MELLGVILLWPILFFALGIAIISLGDSVFFGIVSPSLFIVPLVIIGLIALSNRNKKSEQDQAQGADDMRKGIITFSMSLLAPIFVRYLFLTFERSLEIVIAGLLLGFTLVIWGMFMQDRRVIAKSNIFGGALILLISYFQIWQLGQGARIVAAAAGLIVAVGVSVFKLKDRLS